MTARKEVALSGGKGCDGGEGVTGIVQSSEDLMRHSGKLVSDISRPVYTHQENEVGFLLKTRQCLIQ